MVDYVFWKGARVTPYMAYQLTRLDHDLQSLYGVALLCQSGIRLYSEQVTLFLSRYVTAGNVRGRYVYDKRWWNGQLWFRISGAGTVAAPSTSNHEIQGTTAAVDISDTGASAGITVKNSDRGKWLRAHAHEYDLVASGDSFGEGWHFDILHIFSAVPAGDTSQPFPPATPTPPIPTTPVQQEDIMIAIKSTNKPPLALDGSGYTLLTEEEFQNFWGTKYVGNDRQYDLCVAVYGRLTPWVEPRGSFLGKGQNDRPWTLFAPGYIKILTEEELANSPFTGRRVEGNDRQYDLWVAQAIHGSHGG